MNSRTDRLEVTADAPVTHTGGIAALIGGDPQELVARADVVRSLLGRTQALQPDWHVIDDAMKLLPVVGVTGRHAVAGPAESVDVLEALRRSAAEAELADWRRLRLISAAVEAGHTQQEIAASSGLSQPTVSRLITKIKRYPESVEVTPRRLLLMRAVGLLSTLELMSRLAEWPWTFGHTDPDAPEGAEAWMGGSWDDLAGVNWDLLRDGEYDELRERVQLRRTELDAAAAR